MLRTSDVVQMRLFKKYQMDMNSPHTLSFLHPFSSVGKKEGLAFGVYISIIFLFCFSFELMCRHFGLLTETCVEPFSGSPASIISLTFKSIPLLPPMCSIPSTPIPNIPFFSTPPPPPFAPATQNTSQAANARKYHFHLLHCARVLKSLALT